MDTDQSFHHPIIEEDNVCPAIMACDIMRDNKDQCKNKMLDKLNSKIIKAARKSHLQTSFYVANHSCHDPLMKEILKSYVQQGYEVNHSTHDSLCSGSISWSTTYHDSHKNE